MISILDPFSLLSAKIQLVTFFPPLKLILLDYGADNTH